ncbi:uncharacterized protein VP01_515g2 [Puccinia sorghi]|uniref:Uncharacterized protein n=1 Tax=Puccinia sorghi TaxID=27349 RepID=A0A0L6UKW4_9BASI|nr:uncharacterized protein VP01_515g2 [Puccinia sorghi]
MYSLFLWLQTQDKIVSCETVRHAITSVDVVSNIFAKCIPPATPSLALVHPSWLKSACLAVQRHPIISSITQLVSFQDSCRGAPPSARLHHAGSTFQEIRILELYLDPGFFSSLSHLNTLQLSMIKISKGKFSFLLSSLASSLIELGLHNIFFVGVEKLTESYQLSCIILTCAILLAPAAVCPALPEACTNAPTARGPSATIPWLPSTSTSFIMGLYSHLHLSLYLSLMGYQMDTSELDKSLAQDPVTDHRSPHLRAFEPYPAAGLSGHSSPIHPPVCAHHGVFSVLLRHPLSHNVERPEDGTSLESATCRPHTGTITRAARLARHMISNNLASPPRFANGRSETKHLAHINCRWFLTMWMLTAASSLAIYPDSSPYSRTPITISIYTIQPTTGARREMGTPFVLGIDYNYGYGKVDRLRMNLEQFVHEQAHILDNLYLFMFLIRLDESINEVERERRWQARMRWEEWGDSQGRGMEPDLGGGARRLIMSRMFPAGRRASSSAQ